MYEKKYENTNSSILGTTDGSLTRPFMGYIRIDIVNPDTITAFAWRIKGTENWRRNGYIETNLIVGNTYEIEFKDVDNYDKPDNIFVRIKYNGGVVIKSVLYTPHMGRLQINLTPNIINIFQWKLVNSIIWRNSSDIIDLQVGEYEIEFKEVAGFDKPNNITVIIERDNLSIYEVIYKEHAGCVQIFITPNTKDIFQWKIVGTTTWYDSGTLLDEIPIGTYFIEFKDVIEYQKPDNITIVVEHNTLKPIDVKYTHTPNMYRGSLIVYLTPGTDNIFQWRRKDTLTWKNSHSMEYNLYIGTYEIEFKDVDGYHTPLNIITTITADNLTEENISYIPI